MTAITASMVKDLREMTGAGMMDCKKALSETAGDIDAAVKFLREKGLAAAAKKSGRVATEGLVALHVSGHEGAMVEVNSETDFVAKNDLFRDFVSALSASALGHESVVTLAESTHVASGKTVAEEVIQLIAKIGENITLRRSAKLSVSAGVVAGYIHNAEAPNMGKIGVLVALESTASAEKLTALGKQLAMHIAAANPMFLDRDSVDQAVIDSERSILTEQAKTSGKPAEVIEKMVEGRIRKYYEEIVLLDQTFVIDGETKISAVLENFAKSERTPVKLKAFVRYALGEGLEKKQVDFAEEVKSQLGN